ncbi:hypothetical protein KR222_000856, partial [Zaprionus bogoriensis]
KATDGWTWLLLAICLTTTVGSTVPVGYFFGVLNAPAELIKAWCADILDSEYDTDSSASGLDLLWTSIVSIYLIGGIIGGIFGSLLAPYLNDVMGRRGTIEVSGIIFLVSGLFSFLCRIANSVELLLVGRVVAGVAAALVISTHAMYLVELAPTELSGSVGGFTSIGLTAGIVFGQLFTFNFLLGTEELWHYGISAFLIFIIIGIAPTFSFPESPRYLLSKGKKEQAKATLIRLRKNPRRVDQELAEMEAEASSDSGTMSMREVIGDKKLTLPLFLVITIAIVQAGSGISMVWNYSVGIFTSAGFSVPTAMWLTFSEGVLNFLCALCVPSIMYHFNRRFTTLLSCMLSALFMILLAFGLAFMDTYSWLSFFCIFFLSMYIIGFNLAIGPLPYFVASGAIITNCSIPSHVGLQFTELFAVPPRAVAMALVSFFNWLTSVFLNLIFPLLNDLIDSYVFLICGAFCIIGLVVTYRYLPETRNRKPAEVLPLMENGFKSKIK